MKNVFKFLSLGVLAMVFYAVSATSISAQGTADECTAIYERFKLERVKTTAAELDTAVATAKEYLQKCSTLEPPQPEVKTYVTNQIPRLQAKADDLKIKEIENRFNTVAQGKNYPETISVAKQLINMNRPYNLDLMLVIATIGFDNASANPPVDTYNQDGITYAKLALQKMSEGATSGAGDDYGFLQYTYKTKECPDGKLNATGWMNYIIGYINYSRLNQKKDGVSYLYKSTQNGCFTKTFSPEAYRLIGAWYLDETIRLNNEYKKATELLGNKEDEKTLAMLAMIKGYAERALDAYGKAYKITTVPTWKGNPTYKANLLSRAKEMYDVRYDDVSKADAYIAEVSSKPFVDPATPVTPIVEATPTVTPTPTPTKPNN